LFVVVVLALFGGDSQSTETAGADLTSAEALADLDPDGPGSSTDDAAGATATLPSSTSTSVPATPSSTVAVTTASTTSTALSTTTSTTVATTAPTTAAPSTTASSTTTVPSTTASTAPSTTASTAPPSTEASTTTASTAPPTSPTSAAAPGPGGEDAALQQAVLDATNAARAQNGCPALRLDPQLNAAADGHSEDMAARNYFDHVSPEQNDPGDRIRAAGYPARGWAENIAAGYRSAEAVVDGWMNSPGHRRNILNCDYEELGVGFAQPGYYWTQKFGRR
ncbi:MAG: CAP domain-containing protein, partial [Actinomycetota bacterium]